MNTEEDLQLINFLISTIEEYTSKINTDFDTKDLYSSFLKSLETYKKKEVESYIIDFLSTIEDVFYFENKDTIRCDSGKTILEILSADTILENKIYYWNNYFSTIKIFLKENPFERFGLAELNGENVYFIRFNNENQVFEDAYKITLNRDLLTGDIIDFSEHYFEESVQDHFRTTLFIVKSRRYCVKYDEMNLYLEPYFEGDSK